MVGWPAGWLWVCVPGWGSAGLGWGLLWILLSGSLYGSVISNTSDKLLARNCWRRGSRAAGRAGSTGTARPPSSSGSGSSRKLLGGRATANKIYTPRATDYSITKTITRRKEINTMIC